MSAARTTWTGKHQQLPKAISCTEADAQSANPRAKPYGIGELVQIFIQTSEFHDRRSVRKIAICIVPAVAC